MLVATISVNIAANVVSPVAYDLANLAPKFITFRTGALITGGGRRGHHAVEADRDAGAVHLHLARAGRRGCSARSPGILVADYWIVRRTRLDLTDLYTPADGYWYTSGWNPARRRRFLTGGVLAVGGLPTRPRQGAFPEDGLIPFLKPLADYGWAVGLAASLVVYLALTAGRGGGCEDPPRVPAAPRRPQGACRVLRPVGAGPGRTPISLNRAVEDVRLCGRGWSSSPASPAPGWSTRRRRSRRRCSRRTRRG
ncbi:hypothetical protein GCM10019016_083560 [Streptomyces prasinosporus]|uniref:Uncharacterized protein n=1 Tax=Streptomyces prasinosporus TaxID=68256 RepID=A0ABP6U2V2_9ACTN